MARATCKVAVYGSLRKGLHNHYHLSNAKYVGKFETDPEFTMYSINLAFPGLIQEGNTSVVMEVYQVNLAELGSINRLEGYNGENNSRNHYNRKTIETPYGQAFWYEYNQDTTGRYAVESGDWKRYKENHKLLENAKK